MIKKLLSVGVFAGVQFICSFLTNFYLSKVVTPDTFGNFFYLNGTTQLFTMIIILGVSSSLVRFSNVNNTLNIQLQRVLGNLNFIVLCNYLLLAVLFLFFSLGDRIFNSAQSLTLILLLQIPFVIQNIYATNIFWSFNNFILKGILQNLYFLFQTLFVIIIYYSSFDFFDNIFLVILVSRILSSIVSGIVVKNKFNLNLWAINFKYKSVYKDIETRKFLSFGLWTSLGTISLIAIEFIDRFVISNYLKASNLGYYQAVLSIFSYIYMPFQLTANVLLSYYLKKWEEDFQFVVNKIQLFSLFSIICFVSFSSLYIYFYEDVMTFMFTEKYAILEYEFLILFFINYLIKIIYTITSSLSFISNNPKFLTYSLLLALLCTIILDFALINYLGLKAILVSSIISLLLLMVLLYIQYYKNGIRFNNYYYMFLVLIIISSFFVYAKI